MGMLEIRYVWEWPVRLTHWFNVISIIVLSVTGYYIGDPFVSVPSTSSYVMGWMRYLHFIFAYIFAISWIVRFIWMFFGNRHARFSAFAPWASAKGWKNIVGTFCYYTFLKRDLPHATGHNALAAMAYSGVFILFLVQVVTGFALYGQFAPGGLWDGIFGSFLGLFGNQGLRLTHHVVMWLLIGFAIHHIYSAWLMDIKEKTGTMGSIFSGYKFIDPDEE